MGFSPGAREAGGGDASFFEPLEAGTARAGADQEGR